MSRAHLKSPAAALVAAVVLSATPAAPDCPRGSSVDVLVKGNNAFALRLYHELRTSKGNLFFSPYSISSALAMTYAGARGNTAEEMKEVLQFHLEPAQLHAAFKTLSQELVSGARRTGQNLNIANGLCLTKGDASRQFKALLEDSYDAEIFAGGLDQINGWVKGKTEGRIVKILETLDPRSVCVLLNAIYFKGTWENQFKPKRTHDAPFRLSSKEQVSARLMYQRSKYRLLRKEDFQAIALPYKGEGISMIVLLPHDTDGLTELEKQLTAETLTRWLAELDREPGQETELFLPSFKVETGYDLVPSCRKLGISDAFDAKGQADFRGMGYPKGEVWISQIRHKAFVEVNEEGTEAAAATGVEMGTVSIRDYAVFRADHPFVFVIRENATGSILFLGRMTDPRAG